MELLPIYSVPFWQEEYPDFEDKKQDILNIVKKYKEQNLSVSKTNIFGYQSPETLHSVSELGFLFEYICQLAHKAAHDLDLIECDIALTSAWVNINDSRQCMNTEHVHGDNVFSGIFYLKVPEKSGKLVLKNNLLNSMWLGCKLTDKKNQFTSENIRIEPTEGNILLFPSYLPHSVEPNDHDDERISISFNLILFPKGYMKFD